MKKASKLKLYLIITLTIMTLTGAAQNQAESKVRLSTTMGDIVVKLYNETSLHRDNFLKLVDSCFYDNVLFHRVIKDFMIQAGDPDSRTAQPNQMLGGGDVGYTIPAEFVYPTYYHKRGVLSAARQGDQVNPQKASSGAQFYIVVGKTFTDEELNTMEQNKKRRLESALFQQKSNLHAEEIKKYRLERNQEKLDSLRDEIIAEVQRELSDNNAGKFTSQQREDYKSIGGTPHLDGDYTVFGEVIEGMDVVVEISNKSTGVHDRPVEDVRILKAVRIKD